MTEHRDEVSAGARVDPGRTVDVRDLFRAFQDELLAKADSQRQIPHAPSHGAATEASWKDLLSRMLPNRYGVTGAIVVDCHGRASDQIDLVIYDPQYTPLLFRQDGQTFVVAESVYAVFEVKQRLDAAAIRAAGDKAASVRRLHRTSAPIPHAGGVFEERPPKPILAGVLSYSTGWRNPFGRPFETALTACRELRRLDLGCALGNGAFLRHPLAGVLDGEERTETSGPKTALAFFWISLLEQLQQLGTVTAIDYRVWRTSWT